MKKNNTPVQSSQETSAERLFLKRIQAMRVVARAPERVLDTILALVPPGKIKNSP